ncbi:hypothetical protein YPC_2563 [Yersinia pestis biovar Medievalis str. Harbin 35]|nr:hypothetical protein YPC_2563 [Yersinia pestis biovar Medievalis str. Harbin 35]EEO76494.1 hypothetical protein YP516_2703 [Yersinia pestis Nepal516]EEO81348.1 hypothetical protein YPF_2067 [Yersinia pestis biovar Orientalis str. India 195]EEO90632.1 hypothetical protein YPS_1989 [Yersinia pestis Pestoides A]
MALAALLQRQWRWVISAVLKIIQYRRMDVIGRHQSV